MKIKLLSYIFILLTLFSYVKFSSAEVKLPSIISDNMVLQRNANVSIWGWAEPSEKIMIKSDLLNREVLTEADSDGKWLVNIDTSNEQGPFTMIVKGQQNTVEVNNILIGEVWVCSGQSNMWWPVKWAKDAEREIATANNPGIRLFTVKQTTSNKPSNDCIGQWLVCTPDTVGGFSAVAYYYGRYLNEQLNMPVGLINTSWGGTKIEPWMSREKLNQLHTKDKSMPMAFENFAEAMSDWHQKTNRVDACNTGFIKGCSNIDYDISDWNEMELPAIWERVIPQMDIDGIVWFVKDINILETDLNKTLTLSLGWVDDYDITYFNGAKIGSTGTETADSWAVDRIYSIPSSLLKVGKNRIAVRVFDDYSGGGFTGKAEQMKITDEYNEILIQLAGKWKYKIEHVFNPQKPYLLKPISYNVSSVLYNAMVVPLIPYRIKGAIWYQGESNTSQAYQYRTLFPAMIQDWRDSWHQGNFPFYYVQLAPYRYAEEYIMPELRESQLMALSVPNTGMVVTTDIGDIDDIHPKNKQEVGQRLALWALANTYGKTDIAYSGPLYKGMLIEGNKIRISFDHVYGGLKAKGERITHFIIAGKDEKFYVAQAKIDGNTIVVQSEKVNNPVAVRYAWSDIAIPNLYNDQNLPASPFRTDNWPGVTDKRY